MYYLNFLLVLGCCQTGTGTGSVYVTQDSNMRPFANVEVSVHKHNQSIEL